VFCEFRAITRETRDIFALGRVVPSSHARDARDAVEIRACQKTAEMLIFFSAAAQRFLDGTVNAF